MSDLDDQAVLKAYAEVEDILKTAINGCESKEHFMKALMHLQLTAQRMLGVLLFNAVKSAPNITFEKQFERVTSGIKREFDQLTEAEQDDQNNLTIVDAAFGNKDDAYN